MPFTIRDLLWLILALLLALGWTLDRRQLIVRLDTAEKQLLIQAIDH